MRDHRVAGVCLVFSLLVGRWHAASPQADPRQTAPPQFAPPLQRPLNPAGEVVLRGDGSVGEGSLPVTMLRSPDTSGPGGDGRYLVVLNSGSACSCEPPR